ncbi:MAG: ABC transporter ATP-binding protein [Magnetococcales bacterium]|nr:ABC transporter ATP-binding protein [Magnetococcales bacterium]
MSEAPLIRVDRVSKKFCRHLKRSLWYGVKDVAREMIGRERGRGLRRDEFWAIDDVSFEVKRGEILGLVGHNGSGKTTMLRLINGLIVPDRGEVTIRGRVGALIQLGAGFSPILSGRENIHINGAVLGIPTAEIQRKLDEIIDFADIGKFIDAPVRTYSSGMRARLGFAVAIFMNPDILLVDEVLAVGDLVFRNKAMERMLALANSGVAVVFISHNTGQVSRICQSAVMLEKGQFVAKGSTAEILARYVEVNQPGQRSMLHFPGTEQSFVVRKAALLLKGGQPSKTVLSGDSVTIQLDFEAVKMLDSPLFSLIFEPEDSQAVALLVSQSLNADLRPSYEAGAHQLRVGLPSFSLLPGHYSLRLSVVGLNGVILLGRVANMINFEVVARPDQFNVASKGCHVELQGLWEGSGR